MRLSNYSFLSEVMRFNPRTRKGCDLKFAAWLNPFFVSIHAPVKDATIRIDYLILVQIVSIHAPVKDATTPSCDYYL